jgi:hypothetical protein
LEVKQLQREDSIEQQSRRRETRDGISPTDEREELLRRN